jgi:catechol 2,3-dioxygenase-like lactoylglutathione lyase family enzyme
MQTLGLDHITITISDLAQSRAFYADLLGFVVTDVPEVPPNGAFFLMAGNTSIWFVPSPKPIVGDRFSEFRIGLDHLSFTAPGEDALQQLADKLTAAGVDTKGVEVFAPTGNKYVAFRDPDNIQLEYWLA